MLPIAVNAHAQDSADARVRIEDLFRAQDKVRNINQVAISPDGHQLAWSVLESAGGSHRIFLADREKPQSAVELTSGNQNCNQEEPAWSPDGKHIAFLSDCGSKGQKQLFIADAGETNQQPRRLSTFSGFISHPRWSPDSKRVAVLYVENATRTPSPVAAEGRQVGVIDELGAREVQRIAVTGVGGGAPVQVTPLGLYIFEYDWSPDGNAFVYTAASPPGDDNWYIAKLYRQAVVTPEPQLLYQSKLQIALPRWSPDGTSIAFIAGLMSDEGGTGGEIYIVPASGGSAKNLTPDRKSSPAWLQWLTNSQILFTEFVGGSTEIGTLSPKDGSIKAIWQGDQSIRASEEATSLAISADGRQTALVRASWNQLPEVWAGNIGTWKQITWLNEQIDLSLPTFKNITWSNDGFAVQGWLLFPHNYDPSKRYPMLVAPHGGPAWIATPVWRTSDFNTTIFTNLGYFVFFPNARGSYGQGERFTQANRRDWGFGDLRDTLAGVDEVVKNFPVDNDRVGLLGWSYGGSTTMIAVTQTQRFRAAVAGAGAANWVSYYGQNSIDKWMIPYFGASIYEDEAAYRRCSALTYIRNAKTPTLVVVGERDGEAPPPQSFEFWHALKELGTTTQLVIYADEGHGFSSEQDRIDVAWRTYAWFEKYMPPKAGSH